jgi:hypothetical protein
MQIEALGNLENLRKIKKTKQLYPQQEQENLFISIRCKSF